MDMATILEILAGYLMLEVVKFLVFHFRIRVRRVSDSDELDDHGKQIVNGGQEILERWRNRMVSDIAEGKKVDPEWYATQAHDEIDAFVRKEVLGRTGGDDD